MIRRMILSFFLLLILFITVMTSTDIGLVLLIKLIPGQTSAQYISGSLLRGWHIKKLHYTNSTLRVSIDEINLDWQARALLKQNLVVDNLHVKNANIELIPSSAKSDATFSLPALNLPFNIYLNRLELDKITIHYKKDTHIVNQITLSGEVVNNILHLHQLNILTPTFTTTSQGSIDLRTWSNIIFNNQFTLTSHAAMPILTNITGDQHALSLSIKSKQWLKIDMTLQHYLEKTQNIMLNANWFLDTTKASFPELEKLNGKLQITGNAKGNILHPVIIGKILIKDVSYNTLAIQKLNSDFNFSLDQRQKIALTLFGSGISSGKTLINTVQAKLSGTLTSHYFTLALNLMDNNLFAFSTQGHFPGNNSYSLENAKFDARPLNLIFSPINLTFRWDKNKLLSFVGNLRHNKENLSLQGSTQLRAPDFSTQATIISKTFTVINTEAYKIIVAPNLHIDYNGVIKLKGQLNVLSAHIAPVDLSNTVTLTDDIVYINSQGEPLYPKETPLQLFINVLLKIKTLSINYKGIQAVITGQTKLVQTPSTELSAYGQLQFLEGSYKAYGQALTIQKESTLTFNRAIDNPSLNITASKHISVSPEYITLPSYQPYLIAGIQVTGTASDPIIRLFSLPSGISQQDILSFLIFGFPQNQLSNSQASALWNAFNMMDVSHGDFSLTSIQKNIQNEFGLSEFGLGNTSEYNAATQQYETGTAFVVGKHITDRLTATYNVGLLVPVNVLYLRYQLSKSWALQSDSSVLGNGGDIFYTIRKN